MIVFFCTAYHSVAPSTMAVVFLGLVITDRQTWFSVINVSIWLKKLNKKISTRSCSEIKNLVDICSIWQKLFLKISCHFRKKGWRTMFRSHSIVLNNRNCLIKLSSNKSNWLPIRKRVDALVPDTYKSLDQGHNVKQL